MHLVHLPLTRRFMSIRSGRIAKSRRYEPRSLLTPRAVERCHPAFTRHILAKRRAQGLPPKAQTLSGCFMYEAAEIERALDPESMQTTRTRCALYARSAIEHQNDNGVDKQLATLRDHVRGSGWEVVAEYEDRAVSGISPKRDGLLRLIEGAKSGTFDIVLVRDLDRISRRAADALFFLQSMRSRGVRVYSFADKNFLSPTCLALASAGPEHWIRRKDT